MNSQIGGESGSIYLIVADIGSAIGSGLDFINGYAFLCVFFLFFFFSFVCSAAFLTWFVIISERFYSVYDTANSRVGFATTQYTEATIN